MINQVFCRSLMGSDGTTEVTGFSIPEGRRALSPFLPLLFLSIMGHGGAFL